MMPAHDGQTRQRISVSFKQSIERFQIFRRALNYVIDERLDLENRDAQIISNEHIAFIFLHSFTTEARRGRVAAKTQTP